MCLICVQYELGKMTKSEGYAALFEFVRANDVDEEHADEIVRLLEGTKSHDEED